MRFFGAGQELMGEYPDKALALAQLGQEELGKSLTILSAFSLPAEEEAWSWFWEGWSNHQLKAHRAYLYELISPLRIEVFNGRDGRTYTGLPLRPKLSQEKESGFYVDYDFNLQKFVSPINSVSNIEAASRTMTLAYLSVTADGVRRALQHNNEVFRLQVFGQLAFQICSEPIYQQDMPSIIAKFSQRSSMHAQLIRDLETTLAGNAEFLYGLPGQSKTALPTPNP